MKHIEIIELQIRMLIDNTGKSFIDPNCELFKAYMAGSINYAGYIEAVGHHKRLGFTTVESYAVETDNSVRFYATKSGAESFIARSLKSSEFKRAYFSLTDAPIDLKRSRIATYDEIESIGGSYYPNKIEMNYH